MESGGRFEILEPLGAGALGRLYRARDARLGRLVALRIVSPAIADNPAAREALLAGARKAAAFRHPHAAALLDIVVVRHAHEILCLVHEVAQGEALSVLLAGRPVEPTLALRLAFQVAEALAGGAEAGLVHGALDPANVIVSEDGQAQVLDFGLAPWTACARARAEAARALEGTGADALERPSAIHYVSPEQLLGEAADGRSDVFALGAILHELLTGRPAFRGGSAAHLALQILQADPEPVSRLNPAVPSAADPIVLRALSKSLERRYPTAAAFASDLCQLLASKVDAPLESESSRAVVFEAALCAAPASDADRRPPCRRPVASAPTALRTTPNGAGGRTRSRGAGRADTRGVGSGVGSGARARA